MSHGSSRVRVERLHTETRRVLRFSLCGWTAPGFSCGVGIACIRGCRLGVRRVVPRWLGIPGQHRESHQQRAGVHDGRGFLSSDFEFDLDLTFIYGQLSDSSFLSRLKPAVTLHDGHIVRGPTAVWNCFTVFEVCTQTARNTGCGHQPKNRYQPEANRETC